MAGTAQISWILFLFLCRQAITRITGPPRSLTHFVGENAHFKWNSTDNSILLSATWGIRKGSIADPPFINVNILSNKINVNSDLKPDLISRLSFDGDLWKGQAWFVLKNVTVNDTNEYLARISEDITRVLPYTVLLTVKGRETKENKSEKTNKQTKQPKSQAVPSKLPPKVETYTKEAETETKLTESHASEGRPDNNSLTNSKDGFLPWIIIIIVIIPISIISIIAFIGYKRFRVSHGPNAARGKQENGHHQAQPFVLIDVNNQGPKNNVNIEDLEEGKPRRHESIYQYRPVKAEVFNRRPPGCTKVLENKMKTGGDQFRRLDLLRTLLKVSDPIDFQPLDEGLPRRRNSDLSLLSKTLFLI